MSNSSSAVAVLDCQFSSADHRFTLQWLFDREDEPVYEWSPGKPPKVSGILEGRVDSTFKISNATIDEGRALRIVNLDSKLSGEYTCRVLSDGGGEAHQTKTMLVLNPDMDFGLTARNFEGSDDWEMRCGAHNLIVLPEISLELNSVPIPRLTIFRGSFKNKLYINAYAQVTARDALVTCRLYLPAAGYTAVCTRRLLLKPTHANITAEKSKDSKHSHNSAPAEVKMYNVYTFVILSLMLNLKISCV